MLEKIQITAEADRLTVAAILVKNGYTVKQGKEKRPNGKTCDYFLYIVDSPVTTQKKGV